MGTTILAQRVYSYVPDTVLLLSSSEFQRKINVGSTWFKLRIGFLGALPAADPAGNSNLLAQRIYLGMSSSYGPGVTSFNCANFIGASLTGAPTTDATLTLSTNGYLPYYTGAACVAFAKRGNVYTTATASTAVLFPLSQRALPRRFAYVLEIVRPIGGYGTYTLNLYCSNSASHDWEPADLFKALDTLAAAPTIGGKTMGTYINARTIAWTEPNAPLDTISIHARLSNFPLEISAIGAALLQLAEWSGTAPFVFGGDTFDEYAVASPITSLPEGGTAFTGPWLIGDAIIAFSYGETFDGYPVGSAGTLSQGTGFSGSWIYGDNSYFTRTDSFDTYTVASPTTETLSAGTGFSGSWEYGDAVYAFSYGDDFNSYPVGAAGTLSDGTGFSGAWIYA